MRFKIKNLYPRASLTVRRQNADLVMAEGFSDFQSEDVAVYICGSFSPSDLGQVLTGLNLNKSATLIFTTESQKKLFCDNQSYGTLISQYAFHIAKRFTIEVDSDLYDQSLKIIKHLIDKLCNEIHHIDDIDINIEILNILRYSAVDYISLHTKTLISIRSSMQCLKPKIVVLCSKKKEDAHLIPCILESSTVGRVVLPPKTALISQQLDRIIENPTEAIISKELMARVVDINQINQNININSAKLIITNLADQQYAETVYEVIQKSFGDYFLLSTSPYKHIFNDKTKMGKLHSETALKNKISAIPKKRMAFSSSTLHSNLCTDLIPILNKSSLNLSKVEIAYLSTIFCQDLIRMIIYGNSLRKFFDSIFSNNPIDTVIVCSGRYYESRVAIAQCKKHKITTFDLQAGTISKSARFFPPTSDNILCFDKISFDIYKNHFHIVEKNIHCVGSPRIDSKVREMCNQEAMSSLSRNNKNQKVILLATQPLPLEMQIKIIEIGLGAHQAGWKVIIKPHPNDSIENIAYYRDTLSRQENNGTNSEIDDSSSIYEILPHIDAIGTYFSTVALEGFALKKRVFILDPFTKPPVLDFAAGGIGTRIGNADALCEQLSSSIPWSLWSGHPQLRVLQDGKSVERIIEKIWGGSRARTH